MGSVSTKQPGEGKDHGPWSETVSGTGKPCGIFLTWSFTLLNINNADPPLRVVNINELIVNTLGHGATSDRDNSLSSEAHIFLFLFEAHIF